MTEVFIVTFTDQDLAESFVSVHETPEGAAALVEQQAAGWNPTHHGRPWRWSEGTDEGGRSRAFYSDDPDEEADDYEDTNEEHRYYMVDRVEVKR